MSGNAPGTFGISGMGGVVPPNTLVTPTVQTKAMAGNSTIQPAMSGTAMRLPRFAQNERAPSLWYSRRPK